MVMSVRMTNTCMSFLIGQVFRRGQGHPGVAIRLMAGSLAIVLMNNACSMAPVWRKSLMK